MTDETNTPPDGPKVVHLNTSAPPTEEHPADAILEAGMGKLADVVLVGWGTDGEFFFGASTANMSEMLMLNRLAEELIMDHMTGGGYE